MTHREQEIEKEYRRAERIAIICETADPTPEHLRIAQAEADEWQRLYNAPAESSVQRNLL